MKQNVDAKQSFESAMKRLEEIVALLEDGKTPLDDSLAAFEEGVALVRICNEKLTQAEQKVRILIENEEGEMEEQTFSPIAQ
ncbi:MAG: exodeoxyribonuclease VII small subunit [Clostridia bacterium]|nr:exodeoxyribonuclease VII small subunit [Clostridia bacterium]